MGVAFLHDDARILEQIRAGDEAALTHLYQSSRAPVRAFITRNSGTAGDAEELLQEAVVILWERVRAGRFVYEARLQTFLVGTARNLWLRRLARRRREVPPAIDYADPDSLSPLDELVAGEEAGALALALRRLGEPCTTLLLLFYWEELAMEDIALRMGYANADTAKAKKYQCKKALEKLLREEVPGHG